MKGLYLEDILSVIDGHIFCGKKDQIVKNVTNFHGSLRNNTMCFYLNNRTVNRSIFSKKEDIVIVTEKLSHSFLKLNNNITVVKVDNITEAYWKFVKYYRSLFNIPVIGVTGTCGKTTTTEMIKTILSSKYNTKSTYDGENQLSNNLKYLLGIDENTGAAVFELAVINPGSIADGCAYFQPEVGILLNIGVYHLQGCGTMDNYIKAKAEILEGMNNKGKLIINSDDENINKIDFSQFKGDIITIGLNKEGQFRAEDISQENGRVVFKLYHNNNPYSVYVPGYGKHNVYNAMASIAAAYGIGIPIPEAIASLGEFKQVREHLQFCKGINGSTIINDTWNCTPPSIKAALEVLRDMGRGKKKVAVLGCMPRLGENGNEEYLKIGERVAKEEVDLLVLIGKEARSIGITALEMGLDRNKVYFCNTGYDVLDVLQPNLNSNTLVLLKFPYKCRLRKVSSFRNLMKEMIIN